MLLKDNIPDLMLKKIKKYIDDPKFVPEVAEKSSKVSVFVIFNKYFCLLQEVLNEKEKS